MNDEKLKAIIDRKNERLEEHALSSASEIIDGIATQQARIRNAEKRIAELRAELKELEVQSIDPATILGS